MPDENEPLERLRLATWGERASVFGYGLTCFSRPARVACTPLLNFTFVPATHGSEQGLFPDTYEGDNFFT